MNATNPYPRPKLRSKKQQTGQRRIRLTARILAVAGLWATLVLSGCALPHDTSGGRAWERARLESQDTGGKVARCTQNFATIDDAIVRAGTGDAQAAPIAGFPHLRTTRFLAAMGTRIDPDDGPAFAYWIDWLAQVAIEARTYELANLPRPAREALDRHLGQNAAAVIADCTVTLKNVDRQHGDARNILAATVNVPDDYIDIQRVMGLYPLTAIPVLISFELWKQRNLPSFSRDPSNAGTPGGTTYYAPPVEANVADPEMVAGLLRRAATNPLKLPRPNADELRRLATAFAPVFAVEVRGEFDRIGMPGWAADDTAVLDTNSPFVYVQPSWSIFDGVPLLQISYLAWFSERPASGPMDILSGRLDGLIWRVTIGPDGRALLYDSIHPCGCYHLFFPVPPTKLKDMPFGKFGEGTVVPTDAPMLGPKQRMVLHIGSGNHYLRALSVADAGGLPSTPYQSGPMDVLRSLPRPGGGRASLYAGDGIVAGTDRSERFLLWPMGIASPGAMRQWGTHATAFVGRRHFDDPFLMDRAFFR